MNRRTFTQSLAGVALGASALKPSRRSAGPDRPAGDEVARVPFQISVMLWTVFRELPFEQRLEKVAEAGYRYVQLVGEYAKWSENDFRNVNRKKRELGINFDCTAGIAHGLADPREREAFLSDLRSQLPFLEKLDARRSLSCPATPCQG